jgi:membrane protease YdiL (CAAX protease family)
MSRKALAQGLFSVAMLLLAGFAPASNLIPWYRFNAPELWVILVLVTPGFGTVAFFFLKWWRSPEGLQFSELPIVQAIRTKRGLDVWCIFPLTMIFEELLFRYWLLALSFPTAIPIIRILVNAFLFSFYHLHIYVTTRNCRLTSQFLVISFFLGLLCAAFALSIGWVAALVCHWGSVFFVYWRFSRE